jgi:predicted ATPase
MLESLHIRGYRSLEDVRLPLSPLTVVTGANGTGKSNLYRALQLLARAARGELARAIIDEGGMPSVLWRASAQFNPT